MPPVVPSSGSVVQPEFDSVLLVPAHSMDRASYHAVLSLRKSISRLAVTEASSVLLGTLDPTPAGILDFVLRAPSQLLLNPSPHINVKFNA